MRFDCACDYPLPYPAPQKADDCVRCSGYINPAWCSNDQTLAAFLDRLGSTLPARGEAWQQFRLHVEARELAGRPRFGQTFLAKQNLAEAREEAVDLALYACLDSLRTIREEGGDDDYDMVLTIANHAFRAYEATLHLRAKRHHSTGPAIED